MGIVQATNIYEHFKLPYLVQDENESLCFQRLTHFELLYYTNCPIIDCHSEKPSTHLPEFHIKLDNSVVEVE